MLDNPLIAALRLDADARPVADFDWAEMGVDRRYGILTTGRCGSTWLASLLTDTGLAGAPEEFFNEDSVPAYRQVLGVPDPQSYLREIVAAHTTNRTFGFKIAPHRLLWLRGYLTIPSVFANTAWVYMTRSDTLGQALSFVKAIHTGRWHAYGGDPPADGKLPDDREWFDGRMWWAIDAIRNQERRGEEVIEELGLDPLRLTYEDMLADRQAALVRVLRHVGIAEQPPRVPDRTVRLALGREPRLEDFAERYADRLAQTTV